jgi:hypothetical protein
MTQYADWATLAATKPSLVEQIARGRALDQARSIVGGALPEQAALDAALAELAASPFFGGINVTSRPYNCKGDSASDDTVGFNAAISDANTRGGSIVYVPAGDYRFSQLVLKPGVRIMGVPRTTYSERYTKLRQLDAAAVSAVIYAYPGVIVDTNRLTSATLEGLFLTRSAARANIGVEINFAAACAMRDVQIVNFSTGLQLSDVWDSHFDEVIVTNTDKGVRIINRGDIDNSNNLHFRHVHSETWSVCGLEILGGAGGTNKNNKIYFYGCKIEGAPITAGPGPSLAAIRLGACRSVFFFGGHAAVTSAASAPAGWPLVELAGDNNGVAFRGITLENLGQAIGSLFRFTQTAAAAPNAGIDYEGYAEVTAALSNEMVYYDTGAVDDVSINFLTLYNPNNVRYAKKNTATVTPRCAVQKAGGRQSRIKAVWFGAMGNNATDDLAAVQLAIDTCSYVGSGLGPASAIVELAAGIYLMSNQVVVRKGVRLIGDSERQTVIRAGAAFPNATALVRLGAVGETNCFGTSVERLAIDCNLKTGSIGLYSNSIMEHAGARDVLVMGWMAKGIWVETSGAQNAHFEHLECNIGAGAPAGSRAIHVDATGGRTAFVNVTINGNGAAVQGDGLVLTGGAVATVFDMHGEHVDYVARLISGAGTFVAIDGHASVLSLIRYEAGAGFRASGLYKLGSTNSIQDIANGVTLTSDNQDYWVGAPDSANGWFVRGNKIIGVRSTGWTAPTGTVSKGTFDQSTVTLPQLAQRVAALINDLTTHGLIGP